MKHFVFRSALPGLVILFWSVMGPGVLFAAGPVLTPSISIQEVYNNNVEFASDNPRGDYITIMAARLQLRQSTERLNVNLSGILNRYWYAGSSELDNTDQSCEADCTLSLTERLSLFGGASYLLDATEGRDVENTGLVFDTDQRRKQTYYAGITYQLTERAGLTISGNYSQEDYEDPTNTDSRYNPWQIVYSRKWTECSRVSVSFSFGRYAFDRDWDRYYGSGAVRDIMLEERDVDSYSLTVGAEHALSEKVSFDWSLGGRYTETTYMLDHRMVYFIFGIPQVNIEEDDYHNDSRAAVGRLRFSYHDDRSNVALSVGHDYYPATGFSGLSERTTVNLSAGIRLGQATHLLLAVNYYRNRSESAEEKGADVDVHTLMVRPGIRYSLTPHLDLNCYYLGTWIDNRAAESSLQRSYAAVGFQWRMPLNTP